MKVNVYYSTIETIEVDDRFAERDETGDFLVETSQELDEALWQEVKGNLKGYVFDFIAIHSDEGEVISEY